MMGRVGRYLLSNHYHALPITLLCALSCFFLMPGLLVASLIITLFTLERGYRAGGELLLGVLLPFSVIMYWEHIPIFLILFFIFRYSFNWILAGVFRRYQSWRLIIELMTVVGLLVVLALHFIFGDLTSFWQGLIEQKVQLFDIFQNPSSENTIKQEISNYSAMGTGLIFVFIFLDCSFQILFATFWQRKIYGIDGQATKKHIIRMGPIFSAVFTVILIGKLFNFSMATDCLPVILFPFMISGLNLFHPYAKRNSGFRGALIGLYVAMVFGFPWILLFPVLFSYLDSFLNLEHVYQRIVSLINLQQFSVKKSKK